MCMLGRLGRLPFLLRLLPCVLGLPPVLLLLLAPLHILGLLWLVLQLLLRMLGRLGRLPFLLRLLPCVLGLPPVLLLLLALMHLLGLLQLVLLQMLGRLGLLPVLLRLVLLRMLGRLGLLPVLLRLVLVVVVVVLWTLRLAWLVRLHPASQLGCVSGLACRPLLQLLVHLLLHHLVAQPLQLLLH